MSIGYILNWFPQLSESFVENEIRMVREQGHPVRVFSIYRPPAELSAPTTLAPGAIEYRPSPGLVLMHLLAWLARRPLPLLAETARALRLRSQTQLRGVWLSGWIATGLVRMGAQHVHAHFAHDAAAAGMVAARLTGMSFTLTVHAHELYLRTNGVCARCVAADRVITVCDYNVDQLARLCPNLNRSKVDVIYCGVDVERFSQVLRPPLRPPAQLLSVGRLVSIKGFDLLIRAVGLLRDQGRDVICEIVGQGPLQSDLEQLRDDLGLRDWIVFRGPLLPDDIRQELSECDVFVLACRIDETGNRDSMPVVIKEAMATGAPVVATREAAVPEMVDHTVGRLAEPESPQSLAECIGELLDLSDEERHQLGRNGRRRVCERFNLETEAARLLEVFSSVIRERL